MAWGSQRIPRKSHKPLEPIARSEQPDGLRRLDFVERADIWFADSASLGRGFEMLHRLRVSIVVMVAALNFSSLAFAQSQRPQQPTAGKEPEAGTASHPKTASAPRHDISGTWEPARGPQDGVQADGVKAMPNDGKPEHRLPYTPYGEQVSKSHHALEGASAVLPGF